MVILWFSNKLGWETPIRYSISSVLDTYPHEQSSRESIIVKVYMIILLIASIPFKVVEVRFLCSVFGRRTADGFFECGAKIVLRAVTHPVGNFVHFQIRIF